MKQWIVSLANYPTPDLTFISKQVRSRAEFLVHLVRTHMPKDERDGLGDYEDFMEQAVRLDAAIASFGVENIWLSLNDGHARNLVSSESLPLSQVTQDMGRYGIEFKYSDFYTLSDEDAEADRYAQTATFQKYAGRRIELCGFVPDSGIAVEDSLLSFLGNGITEVIIKATQAKKGLWRFQLPQASANELHDLVLHELDWTAISLEGRTNSLMVQEVIPMAYEYRVFVINQALVTASGCIEEFTPLDNLEQFDSQLRANRADVSAVIVNPKIRDQLVDFAGMVAAELALEKPGLKNYVLDVAMSDGKPVIVELNSFSNAGLYANQPKRVTDALRTSA